MVVFTSGLLSVTLSSSFVFNLKYWILNFKNTELLNKNNKKLKKCYTNNPPAASEDYSFDWLVRMVFYIMLNGLESIFGRKTHLKKLWTSITSISGWKINLSIIIKDDFLNYLIWPRPNVISQRLLVSAPDRPDRLFRITLNVRKKLVQQFFFKYEKLMVDNIFWTPNQISTEQNI